MTVASVTPSPHVTRGEDGTVVCVDFGGSAIRVIVEQAGAFHAPHSAPAIDGEELATAETLIATALSELSGSSARTMSVAVPGVVDTDSFSLRSAHGKYASLRGVNLKQWFEERWNLPFVLENDARAALVGETSRGVARGARDAVLVILGTGIGSAALVDGVALRGHTGHGGILGGHLTVDIHAGRCPCGNTGCAESLASTWALPDDYTLPAERGARKELSALISAAQHCDSQATELLAEFVAVWGATIVSMCHLFDPEVVIVTGGPLKASETLLPSLTEYVADHLWSSLLPPPLVVPDQPELSVFRGLAELARHPQA